MKQLNDKTEAEICFCLPTSGQKTQNSRPDAKLNFELTVSGIASSPARFGELEICVDRRSNPLTEWIARGQKW